MDEALISVLKDSPTIVFMAFVFWQMMRILHRQQRIMMLLLTKHPDLNGHTVDAVMSGEFEDIAG